GPPGRDGQERPRFPGGQDVGKDLLILDREISLQFRKVHFFRPGEVGDGQPDPPQERPRGGQGENRGGGGGGARDLADLLRETAKILRPAIRFRARDFARTLHPRGKKGGLPKDRGEGVVRYGDPEAFQCAFPSEDLELSLRRQKRSPDPQISILGIFRQQVKESGGLSLEGVLDTEVEHDRRAGGRKDLRDLPGSLDPSPLVGSGDGGYEERPAPYREEDGHILEQRLPDGRGRLKDRHPQPGQPCISLPGNLPRRGSGPPDLGGGKRNSGPGRREGKQGGKFPAVDVFRGQDAS